MSPTACTESLGDSWFTHLLIACIYDYISPILTLFFYCLGFVHFLVLTDDFRSPPVIKIG